jgi:hypothetical protein
LLRMGGCGRGPLRRLLAALLLALLLLARPVWAASQSQKNRRWDRVWKTRRKACAAGAGSENHGIAGRSEHSEEDKREEANKQDKEDCAALHPDENDNCVNRCTSPACYAEVYAASPLEPGEIDMPRWRAFERCARKEAREAKRRQWQAQREEV